MKQTVLLLAAAVFTLSATVAGAQYVPDFVSPTIDKTVVVTPHNTYTVPGGPGGGTHYVYPGTHVPSRDTRRQLNRERVRDYERYGRGDRRSEHAR